MPVAPLVLSVAAPARAAVPAIAEACGWAAGLIGVVTGWPQAWRIWVGRRHAGLSLSSNVLGVLYASAWLLYGVASHSFVQVATNLLGVSVLSLVLIGHVVLSRAALRQWLPLLVAGLSVIFAVFLVGARPLGITASIATISGVAPQVVLLARARRAGIADVAGVSRSRWALACACNLLWIGYGVIVGDPVIMANSTVIAAFAAAIVVLAAERPSPAVEVPLEPDFAVAA